MIAALSPAAISNRPSVISSMVAQIILRLISADFLASNYCYDIEMDLIMKKHKEGSAVVIPAIL
jgi:hypothetical protein